MTGPTGTYGGAKVGTSPFPNTLTSIATLCQAEKRSENHAATSVTALDAPASMAAFPSFVLISVSNWVRPRR